MASQPPDSTLARFRVLDVAEVRYAHEGVADDPERDYGVVIEVRRYNDGRYRYNLAPYRENDIGGIYDDEHLQVTGLREVIDQFLLPGPFAHREVVNIDTAANIPADADRSGSVVNAYYDDDVLMVYVFIENKREIEVIAASHLSSTGTVLPPPELNESSTSLSVDPSGKVLNTNSFVLLDSIDRYL